MGELARPARRSAPRSRRVLVEGVAVLEEDRVATCRARARELGGRPAAPDYRDERTAVPLPPSCCSQSRSSRSQGEPRASMRRGRSSCVHKALGRMGAGVILRRTLTEATLACDGPNRLPKDSQEYQGRSRWAEPLCGPLRESCTRSATALRSGERSAPKETGNQPRGSAGTPRGSAPWLVSSHSTPTAELARGGPTRISDLQAGGRVCDGR
jgi:hypothetical protein